MRERKREEREMMACTGILIDLHQMMAEEKKCNSRGNEKETNNICPNGVTPKGASKATRLVPMSNNEMIFGMRIHWQ